MSKTALAVGVLTALAVACGRGSEAPDAPRLPPPARPSALPPDRLAPGELAEGPETSWGFPFPRAFHVDRRFEDAAFASGAASAETAANYVRRHIDAEVVEVGPARTIFLRARVKGAGASGALLRIEVGEGGAGTQILVRNVTPTPAPENLSEEERWKREGLTPQGKPLDPRKVF